MGRDEQTTIDTIQVKTSDVADFALVSNEEAAARPEAAAANPDEAATKPETVYPPEGSASAIATCSGTLDDQKVLQKSFAATKEGKQWNIASGEIPVPETTATGKTNAEEEEEPDLSVPSPTRLTRRNNNSTNQRYANLLPGAYRVTTLSIPETNALREPLGSGRLTSHLGNGSSSSSTRSRLDLERAEQGTYEGTSNSNTSAPPPEAGMAVALPVDEQILAAADAKVEDEDEEWQHRKEQKYRQQKGIAFLSVSIVLAVILALVLGIAFGVRANQKKGNDVNSSTVRDTNNNNSTEPPQTNIDEPSFLFEYLLPGYTLETLRKDILLGRTSPQTLAYQWLINDPNLSQFPDWRKVQRFALATFYYAFGGEGWHLQNRWLDYYYNHTIINNECDWYFKELILSPQNVGIWGDQLENYNAFVELLESACDEQGRYRSLVFTSNNMKGTIPPEVSLLRSSLEFLELGTNEIIGTIPTEVGLLTQLRRFYSDWSNRHTGIIPTELGQLTKLEELDIGYNLFSGQLPTELGLLSNALKFLSIKRTTVTGFLPTELYLLTNLEVFFLHGNTGLSGGAFLPDVGNMTKIQRFITHDIMFHSTIPTEIGLLTDMWELNLWRSSLTGTIPTELWQLTRMFMIDLDMNELTGTLSSGLGQFTNLTQCQFNTNKLTGTLPHKAVNHVGKLTHLSFRSNLFSGSLPTQAGMLSSIEFLDFADNLFSSLVPSELGLLGDTLDTLVLHRNKNLSGTLPTELLALSNLKILTLSNTSLTGSIPNEFCPVVQEVEETCEWYFEGVVEVCMFHEFDNLTCSDTLLCGCHCQKCP